MASLRQIRRRIKSVESIHEITNAMQMIAAFRFKRAEMGYTRSAPYIGEIEPMLLRLIHPEKSVDWPLFEKRAVLKKALVIFAADRGLCGSYNVNIFRAVSEWEQNNSAVENFFYPIGKVGVQFIKKKRLNLLGSFLEKSSADAKTYFDIADELKKAFLDGRVDSIELLYTSYHRGSQGVIKRVPYLGLHYMLDQYQSTSVQKDILFERDYPDVVEALTKRYLVEKLRGVFLESLTSEHNARMIAMKQATDNGDEVLDYLTLLRNKTRQASITNELAEIVSGANSLN